MNTSTLISRAMSELGSRKSKAKTAAARKNGAKGGWPKGKPRKKKD
jgi:hypothetical protein